jgi:MFS family permease
MSVATINDLFFLHERGQQSGVQGIWLTFGSSFAPVICGYLIQSAGWRWYHWLVTILAGINVVLIFFFFPETQYTRDLHKSMDITHAQNHSDLVEPKLSESKALGVEIEELYLHKTKTNRPGRVYVKKSFLQDIKPWSGVDSNVSVIGSLVRPWACWLYPSMVWAVLAFSIHVAW